MKYFPSTNKFQIAISYSEDSSVLANDLYELFTEQGIICYNYKKFADRTKGILEDKISEIYKQSDINLILWTNDYKNKTDDTIVSTEKQVIYERHIKSNDEETLFILINDVNSKEKIEISNKFNRITYHSLNNLGIVKARNYLIERLYECFTYHEVDKSFKISHPHSETLNRGAMQICNFTIDNNCYEDKKWDILGDIKVNLVNSKIEIGELKTYLIPSGNVTTLISHSTILKTQKMSLEIKRRLSREFIKENQGKQLTGYFFKIINRDMEFPYLYCIQYDNWLNKRLSEI